MHVLGGVFCPIDDDNASAPPAADSMTRSLYDEIGDGYDSTRQADPDLAARLARHVGVSTAARYLDVACGTGNYTIALRHIGGTWTGADQSMRMLTRARGKAHDMRWLCADVECLPFPSAAFHSAVCVLAAHHFRSLPQAFREIARVVGERVVVFTSTQEQMQHYWLKEFFPDAMAKSIAQMPDRGTLLHAIEAAGLRVARIDPYSVPGDLQDLFLYAGKHRPWLYLDARVRKGISTFASLADAAELARGLEKLRADIASGRIEQVRRAHDAEGGDYCFIVSEK